MNPLHEKLLTILEGEMPALMAISTQMQVRNAGDMPPALSDLEAARAGTEQMVKGALAAMREYFSDTDREFWNIYHNTVIPGLLANGMKAASLVSMVAYFFSGVAALVATRLHGDPDVEEVCHQLYSFTSDWIGQITQTSYDFLQNQEG